MNRLDIFFPGMIISFLTFGATIFYLSVGIYTFLKNRRSPINLHFLILSLFFSIWSLSASFAISAPSKEAVFFWFDTFSFSWFLFPPFFYHFFLSLSEGKFSLKPSRIFLYLPGIILVIFATGTREIISDFQYGPLGWYIIYNRGGFWYFYNVLHYSAAVIASLVTLFRWYTRTAVSEEKRQARIILFTFIPASVLSTLTGTLLPQLNGIQLPPLVPVIMVIWMVGISLSVTKHNMLVPTWQSSAHTIIENIHESILLLDRNYRIVFVNPAFTMLSGYEATQTADIPVETFFASPFRHGSGSSTLFTNTGAEIAVDVRIEPLFTGGGEQLGYLAVVRDRELRERLAEEIRLRKETADQLKTSDMLFTKAFYLSPIGMIIVDDINKDLLEVNNSALSIFGYARKDVEHASTHSLPLWADEKTEKELHNLIETSGTVVDRKATLLHKDGFPVETMISADKFSLFSRSYLLFCVTDISSQLNLERQLLRMQRMESLGFFASTVVHDLNNIFMALGGNLELARLSVNPEDKTTGDLISSAQGVYDKGKDLLRSVIDYTRIKEGCFPEVDILKVLEEADQLAFHDSAVQRKTVLPQNGVVPINGYPDLLVQLFMNLYINARQALNDCGIVETRITREGDFLLISVSDNGPGIPERFADSIFNKAFSTREEGTGLGLAIVTNIIEKHNGNISLKKDCREGAQFIIRLPASGGFSNDESC
jgi:PAS domain S-box-containing protein